MNREEIENRIEVCEIKAKGYREVGNVKLADKYENEKYKWEKLLSDLNLLNERKIAELLEYKKGYFNLEQENQLLKKVFDEVLEWGQHQDRYTWKQLEGILSKLNELKDSDVDE